MLALIALPSVLISAALQACAPPLSKLQEVSVPFPGAAPRRFSDRQKDQEQPKAFDPALLEFLVCPLSKKPLRYEASTNELINKELGIAYPIIDGIPNMIPQAARMIDRKAQDEEPKQT
uniref:Protein preY, mitochondrial n=1 Tax=Chelonoidis abingdonii TaxID=106734 RepID=A0A8C0IPI0_CHEAB